MYKYYVIAKYVSVDKYVTGNEMDKHSANYGVALINVS